MTLQPHPMPPMSIWVLFSLLLLLVVAPSKALNSQSSQNLNHDLNIHMYKRNLDSVLLSSPLIKGSLLGFGIPVNPAHISEDYPITWAVFISSNETILSNAESAIFYAFECAEPHCYQDNSSSYTLNYPMFSSDEAIRLDISNQPIYIADGAWESVAPLYIRNCEFDKKSANLGQITGQIGLGLSGSGSQNFQAKNPTFSIMVNSLFTGELIFGVDKSYIDDVNSAVVVACDLDWKMQVKSTTMGDLLISSSPITMIFDLQTYYTKFPEPYYSTLKNYFFSLIGENNCFDDPKTPSFLCISHNPEELPPLVFTLENGMQISLSPETYLVKQSLLYVAQFALFAPTYSGTDYIVLGRLVMESYYTVFEKLKDQDPTITLYPLAGKFLKQEVESPQITDNLDPSGVLDTSNSDPFSVNTTVDPTSTPADVQKDTNISSKNTMMNSSEPLMASSENKAHASKTIDNGSGNMILYILIGIIGFIVLFATVLLIGIQKEWFNRGKQVGYQRPTVELNDSSYNNNISDASEASD